MPIYRVGPALVGRCLSAHTNSSQGALQCSVAVSFSPVLCVSRSYRLAAAELAPVAMTTIHPWPIASAVPAARLAVAALATVVATEDATADVIAAPNVRPRRTFSLRGRHTSTQQPAIRCNRMLSPLRSKCLTGLVSSRFKLRRLL